MSGPLCYNLGATGSGRRGALMLAQSRRPRTTATCSKEAALGSGSSALELAMADKKQEEWRAIPGYPDYLVSDHGRVRSLRRGAPRILRGGYSRGYPTANIYGRTVRVHQLVLFAFVGPRPRGGECLHGDGNPHNNRLENLRWGTRGENIKDAVEHGVRFGPRPGIHINQGGANGRSILSSDDVIAIRQSCLPPRELARIYGISVSGISRVRTGSTWKHLSHGEGDDGGAG